MEYYNFFLSSIQGYDIFIDVKEHYSILNKIFGYSKLSIDWNGYNGVPPNTTTCIVSYNTALFLHDSYIKQPKIMLTGSGEISFFWDYEDIHIEISIENNDFSFFISKGYKLILGYDSSRKHIN